MPSHAVYLLETLLTSLSDVLRERGLDDDLCAKALYPGEQVPVDYGTEACGGMAWVRLVTAFPSATFPQPIADPDNCAYSLAYRVEYGIMRPAPLPDDDLDLPDDTEHHEATLRQLEDMDAMHAAWRRAQRKIELMVIESYTGYGPFGGAVGGIWTATVGMEEPD